MMLKLFLYASFGLSIIVVHGDLRRELQTMAQIGDLIHGIFRPVRYIAHCRHGIIFEGKSIIDNRSVAMKFVDIQYNDPQREYAMYTYLDAVYKPIVEKYGIPAIYYYNTYNEQYRLMVFSLFECNLENKAENVKMQPIDNLILFRDFVRQSKYIHSRGIRHDDVKPQNIMLRKHRSFLIDFDLSCKMDEPSSNGTFSFIPRSAHTENVNQRTARDDWESFVYTLSVINGVKLEWFDGIRYLLMRRNESLRVVGDMKANTDETIARIKAKITFPQLQQVFVAFAREAFKNDRSLPDYDALDKLIMKKIEKLIGKDQPALFTWLSQPERDEAVEDLMNNPPVKATDIELRPLEYPAVEYDYFDVQRDEMAKKRAPTRQNYLRKKREEKSKRSCCAKCLPKCLK